MSFLGKSRKRLILRDFFVLYKLQPCFLMQLQARLTRMLNQSLLRAVKMAGLLALLTALALPTAGATTPKSQTAKKQQVTKATASKKPVTSKKATAVRKKAKVVAATKRKSVVRVVVPPKQSFGQIAGLHSSPDPLDLKSSVALVIDQDTREVLFRKNDHAVLPIASLTKLMTGVIISGAKLPMDETITITQDDVDTEKGSTSRLKVGTSLTRGEMLHLALMSSENRAANALGRTYPGGLEVFVSLMNAKAKLLGMSDTRYVEPTGLSSRNQSSAQDLAALVSAAHADPMLRELSTSASYQVAVGNRTLQYNTTNRLIKNPEWDIGLQKTGYISEAGQCLVMQTKIAGRKLIMVFLDSAGKLSRMGDAERVRRWVEANRLINPIANPAANPIAVDRKVNISM
jgi:D-alanyl-D-alanine endopeptidase (penicillin-binding protein 7)